MNTPHASTSRESALAEWLDRANRTQLPVFSATVREVTSITSSSRSSAKDLAEAIGRDAALAAKLLKTASSPLFGRQPRSVRTINQAVVTLGFDAVRDLAISLSIIDQATKAEQREPLFNALLRAFHSAAQARSIAVASNDQLPEEVFLAGLMSRLGELVFWASGTPEAEALVELAQENSLTAEQQLTHLGFSFDELSAELAQQWHLSALLRESLGPPEDKPRVSGVQLAQRIAQSSELNDWQSCTVDDYRSRPALADLVDERAELLKERPPAAFEAMQTQADQTIAIARRFGMSALLAERASKAQQNAAPSPEASTAPSLAGQPNPVRQLEVLTAMTELMQGPVTLDQLLRLAIDGIVDGAGFDRVLFALLTPDRSELRLKHRHGISGDLPARLALSDNPTLAQALDEAAPTLIRSAWALAGSPLWPTAPISVVQGVRAANTAIGVLYADRASSGPEIEPVSVTAMGLFVQQIALGLNSSANR
ncbi:MAG: HDOD domain-containing protein [Pseudomonadota bacterium]